MMKQSNKRTHDDSARKNKSLSPRKLNRNSQNNFSSHLGVRPVGPQAAVAHDDVHHGQAPHPVDGPRVDPRPLGRPPCRGVPLVAWRGEGPVGGGAPESARIAPPRERRPLISSPRARRHATAARINGSRSLTGKGLSHLGGSSGGDMTCGEPAGRRVDGGRGQGGGRGGKGWGRTDRRSHTTPQASITLCPATVG